MGQATYSGAIWAPASRAGSLCWWGSIPLEALRLGCQTYACDYNVILPVRAIKNNGCARRACNGSGVPKSVASCQSVFLSINPSGIA
jgi:hypothetical protein